MWPVACGMRSSRTLVWNKKTHQAALHSQRSITAPSIAYDDYLPHLPFLLTVCFQMQPTRQLSITVVVVGARPFFSRPG